jgi:hypothetical protein
MARAIDELMNPGRSGWLKLFSIHKHLVSEETL